MNRVLFMALSCLQGYPMEVAAAELTQLGCGALQLTPGCSPTGAFSAWLDYHAVTCRVHDGFSWLAPRQPVWTADGRPRVGAESVHPPRAGGESETWLEASLAANVAVEVMYPGHALGTGVAVEQAMAMGVALAVDVSHLHIQACSGVLDDGQLRRILNYDRVEEIHISGNDGRADRHWPVGPNTFGLDWARERSVGGVPVICESYVHRCSTDERAVMVDRLQDWLG